MALLINLLKFFIMEQSERAGWGNGTIGSLARVRGDGIGVIAAILQGEYNRILVTGTLGITVL